MGLTHSSRTRGGEVSSSVYVGTKWGNLHFLAPPVYHKIVAQGSAKLGRLGDHYDVAYGIKTGADAFFVLRRVSPSKDKGSSLIYQNGFDRTFKIEKKFCSPIPLDSEDVSSYFLSHRNLTTYLFICRES